MPTTAIVWFRRDLRLADNPALTRALALCDRVIPVYVHAPQEEAPWQPGAASRWWLHHSLTALDGALRERGSGLVVAAGESRAQLRRIARACAATRVFWNRLYEAAAVARDSAIKQALRGDGLGCESFNAALLFEPWEIATGNREPYRVFSAFWRKACARLPAGDTQSAPDALPPLPAGLEPLPLAALGLLSPLPWDAGLAATWRPGEPGAAAQAQRFFTGAIASYAAGRDVPAHPGTSRLSPHLHFGEIGPHALLGLAVRATGSALAGPAEPFVRELGWREFAHHLLYYFPHTPQAPLDRRFDDFPWRTDGAQALLAAWQRGRTGIPLVDAGMRELWSTGWMHNRIRMVAASWLTKNLRLPWQEGAHWFWDTLVDADLAANTLGWQWTAGCGADAAPYFRVFNPMRQGERFDPEGEYVKRWCPELGRLPRQYIHQPWTAPAALLAQARLVLGSDYPLPCVDPGDSRKQALAAWARIKG